MSDFSEKAKRYAKTLDDDDLERDEEDGEEEEEGEGEEEEVPLPGLYPPPVVLQGLPVDDERYQLANPNAAMLFLKADKTSENATFAEAFVDHTVQFGQPYPAITHCEIWVGERAAEPSDDNHFSTYLGASEGATWTSGLADSRRFYGCGSPLTEDITRRQARSSWSAIPIFAVSGAEKMRGECNRHHGTAYPPAFLLWQVRLVALKPTHAHLAAFSSAKRLLWQYPMSTWPLRAFSGLVDDRINAPAHCAALSARILRMALPKTYTLDHPSHWYGPSSLYLELSTPMRMEEALAHEQPTIRSTDEEEELDNFADTLAQHSDDDVTEMRREDAHKALRQLALHVLRAGSRVDGAEVDQDNFREAQERYAWGLCRYTWKHRKGASP